MWFWVPRSEIYGRGAAGAGGALLAVLVIVGLLHAMFAAIFAVSAAAVATIVIWIVVRASGSELEVRATRLAAFQGFMAFTITTLVLDLIVGTSYSVPAMIVALDGLACDPHCGSWQMVDGYFPVAIPTVAAYYDTKVTPSLLSTLQYLLQLVPGLIAFAAVLLMADLPAFSDRRGLVRLGVASVISVSLAMLFVFPLMVSLMIALRDLDRPH